MTKVVFNLIELGEPDFIYGGWSFWFEAMKYADELAYTHSLFMLTEGLGAATTEGPKLVVEPIQEAYELWQASKLFENKVLKGD